MLPDDRRSVSRRVLVVADDACTALGAFAADEILLVTAPRRPSRWLRRNVVDRARDTFPQAIAHAVMPTEAERSEE